MNRTLVIASTIALAAVGLAGCGGSDSDSAKGGGHAMVQVDGKDVAGIDMSKAGCTKVGDTVTLGGGTISGTAGVAAILTGNPPKAQSIAIKGEGVSVTALPSANQGTAEVKVDGDNYTITGTAVDLSNITGGKKSFEIMVTCK